MIPRIRLHAEYDRRTFLQFAGTAAAATFAGRWSVAATKPAFEVSASLYAWELHDEGVEKILDNLQTMAAVNSVYLLGLMHYEKRPVTSAAFPHNPVRKTWQAEDARVYWHPDMKHYGRIKPRLSDFAWLNQTDWVAQLVEAARKRGMMTGVEISHTPLDAERGGGEFSDCIQRDIQGQPRVIYGRGFPICPNSPDARQYVLNLFTELTARYDVDYLQTATIPFMPGGADKGGCFCNSCVEVAKRESFDLTRAREALKQNPQAQPALDQWQSFRQKSMVRYYKAMHDGIHATRAGADLRFSDSFPKPADWGLDFSLLKPHFDSLRVCDYSEQRGNPALMKNKREWLTSERLAMGKDFPMLSAIAVRPKATPELIREGVRIAVVCGMNGITLGHYDGAEFPMLRAIRTGMAEAKVG